MKATIFLLGLCLCAISVMGQQNHRKSQIGQNHFQMNRNLTTTVFQNRVEMLQKKEINKMFNNLPNQFPKSANIVKQSLDSVVYEVFDEQSGTFIRDGKEEFTYDSNGNLTTEIYYDLDETNSIWSGDDKYEYTYDSNGNLTLEIRYNFDKSNRKWIELQKDEITYDLSGNMTLRIVYDWDETTSKWDISYKSEYVFDSNGNLILKVHYMWDKTINEWIVGIKIENGYNSEGFLTIQIDYNSKADEVTRKEEFTYNLNGKLTSKIGFRWEEATSKWNIIGKNEYTYDSNGNLTIDIEYRWDKTNSKWIDGWYKYEYTNDSKGNPLVHIYYNWDETTSEWVVISKSENIYDSNGNSISGSSYEWDEENNKWLDSTKWEDGYDSYGNLTFISEYKWDETIGNWIVFKDESIYDYNYLAKDLILPYWFQDENIKHKITDVLFYATNENTGQLYVERRDMLFYSDKIITGIDVSIQKELRIYPNPASDYLNLDFNNISGSAVMELYDYQGKMVFKEEVYPDIKMFVKHLKRGLYLYKLNYPNTTETGKILILR